MIDNEGESLDEAIVEVTSYFEDDVPPLLDGSVVAFDGDAAVSPAWCPSRKSVR
jgi:hypothetical protein